MAHEYTDFYRELSSLGYQIEPIEDKLPEQVTREEYITLFESRSPLVDILDAPDPLRAPPGEYDDWCEQLYRWKYANGEYTNHKHYYISGNEQNCVELQEMETYSDDLREFNAHWIQSTEIDPYSHWPIE